VEGALIFLVDLNIIVALEVVWVIVNHNILADSCKSQVPSRWCLNRRLCFKSDKLRSGGFNARSFYRSTTFH
jgi:hypothetical protein